MTSSIYPEMLLDGRFVVETMEDALNFDSTQSTHMLSHYEELPHAVREQLFDSIAYNKCK
jgi:hypothetical protein